MALTATKPFGEKAVFACDPAATRGRLFPEPENAVRDAFQRDRDRIIHAKAFRRLKHKTQVFVYTEGDYYRTRLTHSLEVAQIARTICRYLGLNEDLAEALSLAHDFGHPPFGHAGEDALAACMAPYGGFDHNIQSLRLLTELEQRYPRYDGLNLCWETLEGIAKHNGPLCAPGEEGSLDPLLQRYNRAHDLELHTFAGAEAQTAALSDDIAYNNHDIDDGLQAGLFDFAAVAEVSLVGEILAGIDREYADLSPMRRRHELVRRLINTMVQDLLSESISRIGKLAPRSPADIRNAERPVIAFSADMQKAEKDLKTFLRDNMYRHDKVALMADRARRTVSELFRFYMDNIDKLPGEWRAQTTSGDAAANARLIADFIGGMTDRFAQHEHARHCTEAGEPMDGPDT